MTPTTKEERERWARIHQDKLTQRLIADVDRLEEALRRIDDLLNDGQFVAAHAEIRKAIGEAK